ncbi:MAG: right-handed parallel beta-helix repeat-containing protein, partial [Myxococcales bacterium]|nr:right-handed parallel beta-helix repeat-containing protein [Myxococcales bacterium]
MRTLLVVLAVLAAPVTAAADTYEVGPGLARQEVDEVPFESLGAGDVVEIHWRAQPYAAKFVIGNGGTAQAPLIVRGVPGPGGELPVIDGDGATTRAALDYWNQVRSVVKIGGSSSPADAPSYVVVEGLDVRAGHPDHGFTDSAGAAQTYAGNAAAIHVENGDHITIRGCVLRDSANGLFVSSGARDVVVAGNHIHGNGVVGDIYVHNSYTEADGIVFEHNWYGPLAPGAGGNNLKDRSAGLIVRYNWIEDGNRQLDLVDSDAFATLPSYRTTLVYGNVLVEGDGEGNRQIVHYGGDGGDEAVYRKGTLYFYANTVVSTRSDRTTLFRLSSSGETADVRGNIFFTTGAAGDTELTAQDGDLVWGDNWIRAGYVTSFAGATGTITDLGGDVGGAEPGFVDAAAGDFHLRDDAAARDVGPTLAAGVPPVDAQYVV